MNLPFFYAERIDFSNKIIVLDEETSRHCVQVLRMKRGEQLQLTDGRGNLLTTEIINDHKKSTQVSVLSTVAYEPQPRKISIAISLIKNTGRFEWFLEKATEIGVNGIFPLICERTEKQHFRAGRMKGILVSAMLQSRQVWLPELEEPLGFNDCLQKYHPPQRFIAHCVDDEKRPLGSINNMNTDAMILIGPEGDFTKNEIGLALKENVLPVTLGKTRLRTETAGVVAAAILVLCQRSIFV